MPRKSRNSRADRLFDAALQRPPADRAAFLDRECAGDAELRALVERLLGHVDTPTVAGLATGGALDASPGAFEAPVFDMTGAMLGRYRLLREVGRGGMGVVYEARDERLERVVAVKLLAVSAIGAEARERFLREARAAAALNHPNVVALYDAGEEQGRPYLVAEFVSGAGLDVSPPESLDEALAIALRICDALEHAHARGLVHRDLKPGNVLVRRDGTEPIVKLADMGIALARGSARVTRSGAITGTPAFMAPEQALGQPADGRADLYALGVMLYLWTTGRPPFDGDDALAVISQHIHAPVVPPRAFRTDLPAGLEPLILRLLEKSPQARFASAAELRQALVSVRSSDPTEVAAARPVAIEGLARGRMVGRKQELERIQALWREALAGRSQMALISGEPGVGKTRLAREITATARLDGAPVLTGGCYEHEATMPYLPFVEAFRQYARDLDDGALAIALGDSAAELARLAPEIESRLGPFPPRAGLPPHEERLRLFDHVARFLRGLSAGRGLLFFVDDLQWADHGSLALLHFLLRELDADRVLFLGTYREVELDRSHPLSRALVDWERERAATRVRLERLDREATARMVATLLGQEQVAVQFIDKLHAETEGNPFFVEEIVKALIADGDLVHRGSIWTRRSSGEFILPQSVKAAIGSRLERVSDTCSEVLRTAAVLGKQFEFAELAAIAPQSENELLDALDEAVAAQLIVAKRGESFAFTHDKIREVLYDELNPIRRRRLHAAIAAGLERLSERDARVAVEVLAHHFIESGDHDKGLHWAERAAATASRVYAYDEALEILSRARDCADVLGRVDALSRIDQATGDAAFARGDVSAAARHYESALQTAADDGRQDALRCMAAEAYVISGDRRGLEHVRQVLVRGDPRRSPAVTAQAMMLEARYLHLEGQLVRAVEIYRPAVALVEPLDRPDLLVRMLSYLAGTLQHLAEFDESDRVAQRCIEIGERQNVPVGVMFGCEFLCENNIYRGRWCESVRQGECEESLARETHAGERLGWSHFRVYALLGLGRLAEAERLAVQGIAETERSGDRRLGLFLRAAYGVTLFDSGRLDRGIALLREVLAEADEAGLLAHRISGRGHLSRALARSGNVHDAAAHARHAIELWRASNSRGFALIHGADFAEALVRSGDLDEARIVLEAHRELATFTGAEQRLGQNLRVSGLLAAAAGHLDEALVALDTAAEKLEAQESPIDLAITLADRARLSHGRASSSPPDVDLARARKLLADCGATPSLLDTRGNVA